MSAPAPVTALRCPEAPCPVTSEAIGTLSAHLITDHLVSPSTALERARRVAASIDPFGLDRNGITEHVEPPVTPAVTPPTKEAPVPNKANPAGCKVCQKLAPAKCKRHGGPGRSTSNGGRGPNPRRAVQAAPARSHAAPAAPRTPAPVGRDGTSPYAVVIADLDTKIATLTSIRDQLKAL